MKQIWFLFIGLIAGLLGGLLIRGNRSTLIGDMIVGILGSFIGGMMFGTLSSSQNGLLGPSLAALAGAAILLAVAEVTRKI